MTGNRGETLAVRLEADAVGVMCAFWVPLGWSHVRLFWEPLGKELGITFSPLAFSY